MSNFLGAYFCRTIESSTSEAMEKHSHEAVVEFRNLKVMTIPALTDNFMYLVIDKATRKAFAVDPVEPESLLNVVKREEAILTSVLITHHHWDHAGGNNKLLQLHASNHPKSDRLNIYGGDDRIDGLNKKVGHSDHISIGSMNINCLFTPCHTTGHICYFVNTSDLEMQKPLVFTGDTLFIGGCGRFFEGTAEDMYKALLETLGTLPTDTLVFCGHEYTVANLKFILSVDKDNFDAVMKLEWAKKMRDLKNVTVPSTLDEEMCYNVFMRCNLPAIQKAVNATGSIQCMDKLRTLKNNF